MIFYLTARAVPFRRADGALQGSLRVRGNGAGCIPRLGVIADLFTDCGAGIVPAFAMTAIARVLLSSSGVPRSGKDFGRSLLCGRAATLKNNNDQPCRCLPRLITDERL